MKFKIRNKLMFFVGILNIPIAGLLWIAFPVYGAMVTGVVLVNLVLCCQFTEDWEEKIGRVLGFSLENLSFILLFLLELSFLYLLFTKGGFALGVCATLFWVVFLFDYAKKNGQIGKK